MCVQSQSLIIALLRAQTSHCTSTSLYGQIHANKEFGLRGAAYHTQMLCNKEAVPKYDPYFHLLPMYTLRCLEMLVGSGNIQSEGPKVMFSYKLPHPEVT